MNGESRRVCRLRASSAGSALCSIAPDTGRPVLLGDFPATKTEPDIHLRASSVSDPRLPDPDQSTRSEVAVRLG
jgi:hypothetical protein